MTLEKRIEALERRCKRLGKTLVGVGTLALFAVVAGTAGWTVAYTGAISPSSITTSSIFLKDKAGNKRVGLYGSGAGGIAVYDKAEKMRISLLGDNSSVILYDSAKGDLNPGKKRIVLDAPTGKVSFTAPNGKTISHP